MNGLFNENHKVNDLIVFAKILNTAVRNNVPMPKFLMDISKIIPDTGLRNLIDKVHKGLSEGKQLYEILALEKNFIENSFASDFLINLLAISDNYSLSKAIMLYIKHYLFYINLKEKLKQVLISQLLFLWFFLINVVVANITFLPRLSEVLIERNLNYSFIMYFFYFMDFNTWPWSIIFFLLIIKAIYEITIILYTNKFENFYNTIIAKIFKITDFIEYEELTRIYRLLGILLSSKFDFGKSLLFIQQYGSIKIYYNDISQAFIKLKNGSDFENVCSESVVLKPLASSYSSYIKDDIITSIDSLSDVYGTMAEKQLDNIKLRVYFVTVLFVSILVLLFALSIFVPYYNVITWKLVNV